MVITTNFVVLGSGSFPSLPLYGGSCALQATDYSVSLLGLGSSDNGSLSPNMARTTVCSVSPSLAAGIVRV